MAKFFLEADFNNLSSQLCRLRARFQELNQASGQACEQVSETWHDNAPFTEAVLEMRTISRQISDLENTLAEASVVAKPENNEQARIGSIITLQNMGNGQLQIITLGSYQVPLQTTDEQKTVSYTSPLGQLLLKQKVGAEISMPTKKYRIIEIS